MLIAIFLFVLLLEGLVYFLARGRTRELFEKLDSREYPFKATFMPMGYYLLSAIGYKFTTPYDSKLCNRLAELYDCSKGRLQLQIHWAKKTGNLLVGLLLGSFLLVAYGETDFIVVIFILLVAVTLFMAPDYEIHKQLEERHLRIRLDFPNFISKLLLLINAGMTVNRAWDRVVSTSKRNTPLDDEVTRVLQEIKGGKPEGQAYEEFARRCRTPEVTRFITVILQNMRKGNAEMVAILRVQANECWEMRKHAAKRLGEEAETKLLLPLMLMLVAILMIVATPAMLALKNM